MKQIKTLVYYEWLNFKAEKGILLFILLLLLCGFYGIFSGTAEINRQKEKIARLDALYQQNIAEMKVKFPGDADAGDIGYYHAAFAKNIPGSWAALAIGQRDVNPSYLKIRLLALQNQLYNSENTNPNQLAIGSFDLAFVFVFLLPLFIIAISFNMLSSEKEKGTLTLILSQPVSLLTVCLSKLLLRFMLIFLLVIVLLSAGVWWTGANADLRFGYWLLAITLYCLFWFGIVFCIVALHKSSAFNAVTLLSVWLLLTVIFPVVINVLAELQKPVPDGLALSLKQREEVHAGWDKPKGQTMQKFFVRYPQFSGTSPIKGRFGWKWYFAFQELGDQSVEEMADQYAFKLADRQAYISRWSKLSAPAVLQELLNAAAATDIHQHLNFLQSVASYHDELKDFYYPFLFHDRPFKHADFAREPQHSFTATADQQKVNSQLFTLLIETLVAGTAAVFIYRTARKASS
jgi:ABC-2 type transport system permease protein